MPAPIPAPCSAALLSLVVTLTPYLHYSLNGSISAPAVFPIGVKAVDSKRSVRSWWVTAERLAVTTRKTLDRAETALERGDESAVAAEIGTMQQHAERASFQVTIYVPSGLDDTSTDMFMALRQYRTALAMIALSNPADRKADLESARGYAAAGDAAFRSASEETRRQYTNLGGRKQDIALARVTSASAAPAR